MRGKLSKGFGVVVCLLGMLSVAQAQTLKEMISPMSNPVNFEDPRNITELRALWVYHKLDSQFVTEGGSIQVYALQARLALSEDFTLLATKDGYVITKPDAVLNDKSGLGNIEVGGKYSVYRDEASILSAMLRYEIPVGDEDVLQGEGDGMIHPSLSYGKAFGDFNMMAAGGMRIGVDSEDSSFFDLDLHFDYNLSGFYPLVEFNLVHVYQSGERLPSADEGQDYFNLGSIESAGENILTSAVGARYRVCDNVDLGLVYQFPLDRSTGSRIIDWRLGTDVIVRF